MNRPTMKKLHRYDYDELDGKLVRVRKDVLYAWAAVNLNTGEVDIEDVRQYDDELEVLNPGWEWVKFNLVPALEKGDQP